MGFFPVNECRKRLNGGLSPSIGFYLETDIPTDVPVEGNKLGIHRTERACARMPDEVDDGLKRAVRVDNGAFSTCDFLFHDSAMTSQLTSSESSKVAGCSPSGTSTVSLFMNYREKLGS